MNQKKKSKFGSIKADPLFHRAQSLEFEDFDSEEILELTEDQKASAFLSEYLENHNPIGYYPKYFASSVKGEAWELKELKQFYIRLVLSKKWSEEKFIAVVNSIYRDNQVMSTIVLDARGRIFDNGGLREVEGRGSSRRRGRI